MSQADEGSAADPELATENESPTGEVAAAAPSEEEQQGPTGLRAEQQEGPTGLTAEEEQGPTGLRAEEEQGPTGLRAEEEEGPTGLKAEEEQGPTGLTAEEEEGPTGLTAEEEQAPTDLTASPAFQCLDELLSAGKITDTRVAELKEQYTLLHEAVISLQESESHLLQEAERLSAELEQQSELEKAEQLSEEAPSEGSQIRQQLFSCRSEYNATKGRVNENRLKIECLREEKKLLEDEYERMSKEKKNDKVQQLKESCDELSEEVIQRKAEIDSMKEAVSSKEKMILTDEEEMKKLQEMHTYLKAELVRILGVPKQLAKETEKLKQKKIDAEKQNEALNDQIEELNSTLRATEKRTEEILQEKKEVMKEMDERQTLIQKNERQCNNLTKSLEINAEKEFAILSDRQILENNLDKCVSENKNQQDILSNHQTKKDKELKSLKKLELQLKSIWDSLEADKATHKRLKSEAESNSKYNAVLLERRQELQDEIETIKRDLAEQEMISETDARALEECIAAERSLFKEQEKCRNELATLTRLTLLKADEKQLKSRDVQKAKIQLQSLVKELKRMDSELTICKKMKKENEKEIQGVVKMCELMQIEKDKSIDLMRIAQWKAKEGEHRVKLLENNIENLRHAVMTRERKLQEDYMKIKKNERMKEFIKNDYVKVEQEMLENKEKEKYLHVDSLTAAATHVEKEISQLHKNYERVIEQRNESGLLLREREEEVGVLYEKINRQEVLRRNGETKMQVMDEKISFLKLKLVEKKREVKLCFKELSVKNALDAQLVKVRTQYSQCRDKIKKLEENYGDATNESRKQEMGGKDPSPPELLKRIDKIEAELVQKEQRLLKIDFLCENISDLTDRMRTVVESGRQDMLLFARRSNELQSDINRKTQQIRALFAELSMKQAFALRLQQEIRDKEQSVMTASWMISQGLSPPKAEMDDWKILDSEKIQKAEAEARAEEPPEEEEVALPSYYSTTLEEEEQEEQQEVEEEEQELEQEEQQEEEEGLSSDQVSPGQDI